MAFLWDQKERLLRESWTADNLAQELYAMFGENVPNNTGAPVNVTANGTTPPFNVLNGIDGQQGIIGVRGKDGKLLFEITAGKDGVGIDGKPGVTGGGGGVPVWG